MVVEVREAGSVQVLGNQEYGNLTSLAVTGSHALQRRARALMWGVGRFPGVVGFSFSGLFSQQLV